MLQDARLLCDSSKILIPCVNADVIIRAAIEARSEMQNRFMERRPCFFGTKN